MHIGATINLPSLTSLDKRKLAVPVVEETASKASTTRDPFEGLPFRRMAEALGENVMPALQAAREEKRLRQRQGRLAAAQEVETPSIPHVLPITRWAAQSDRLRATLVDDPAKRPRARLSWYHPDDTMVPRDWFRGGLLADLKYYMPFCSTT